MPKARVLEPAFWDDPAIASLTRDERLMVVGMITRLADDEGRLHADPGYIRKELFGYEDDCTKSYILQMRDSIVAKWRNIKLYEYEGQQYLWLANFVDVQKMRYPVKSKLPAFQESTEIHGNLPRIDGNAQPCSDLSIKSVASVGFEVGFDVEVGFEGEHGAKAAPCASPLPQNIANTAHGLPGKSKPITSIRHAVENSLADRGRKWLATYPNQIDLDEAMRTWLSIVKTEEDAERIEAGTERYRVSAKWCDNEGNLDPLKAKSPKYFLVDRSFNDKPTPFKARDPTTGIKKSRYELGTEEILENWKDD